MTPTPPWTWKYDAKDNKYFVTEDLGNGVEAYAQVVAREPDGRWTSVAGQTKATSAEARASAEENLVLAGWAETSPGTVTQISEPYWRVIGTDLRLAGRQHVAAVALSGITTVYRRGPLGTNITRWADFFPGDIPGACRAAENALRQIDKPLEGT